MYDLCERFAIYDEEREAIEQYVITLSEEDQTEFFRFKKRNAVGLGLEPSPFEGIKAAEVFRMDKNHLIIYDKYDFEHYKHYIDELAGSYADKPEALKYIIGDELENVERRLAELRSEGLSINNKADKDANIESRIVVEKGIAYLNSILDPQKVTENRSSSHKVKRTPRNISPDLQENKTKAKEILAHLSGRFNGERIISKEDYKRLIKYTTFLIEHKKLPNDIVPIKPIAEFPKEHIRYSYYRIYQGLYGSKPDRDQFIDFLYAVFPSRFNENELQWSTTSTKFSTKPSLYYTDLKSITG